VKIAFDNIPMDQVKGVEDQLGIKADDIRDVEFIEKVYDDFQRYLQGQLKTLRLSLIVREKRENGFMDLPDIKSWICSGQLRSNHEFVIHIKTSYKAEYIVFWITSKGKIYDVYPFQKLGGEPGYEPDDSITGSGLYIGKKQGFVVHTPEGWDHCVVLERKEAFTKKEMKPIEDIIKSSIKGICFEGLYKGAEPKMFKHKIPQKKQSDPEPAGELQEDGYEDVRFGLAPDNDEWQDDLKSNLAGVARAVAVFSIPNNQS